MRLQNADLCVKKFPVNIWTIKVVARWYLTCEITSRSSREQHVLKISIYSIAWLIWSWLRLLKDPMLQNIPLWDTLLQFQENVVFVLHPDVFGGRFLLGSWGLLISSSLPLMSTFTQKGLNALSFRIVCNTLIVTVWVSGLAQQKSLGFVRPYVDYDCVLRGASPIIAPNNKSSFS